MNSQQPSPNRHGRKKTSAKRPARGPPPSIATPSQFTRATIGSSRGAIEQSPASHVRTASRIARRSSSWSKFEPTPTHVQHERKYDSRITHTASPPSQSHVSSAFHNIRKHKRSSRQTDAKARDITSSGTVSGTSRAGTDHATSRQEASRQRRNTGRQERSPGRRRKSPRRAQRSHTATLGPTSSTSGVAGLFTNLLEKLKRNLAVQEERNDSTRARVRAISAPHANPGASAQALRNPDDSHALVRANQIASLDHSERPASSATKISRGEDVAVARHDHPQRRRRLVTLELWVER